MRNLSTARWLFAGLIFAASSAVASAQTEPPPTPMTIVVYEAGVNWKQGKPPGEQNMGPHFGYVGELFKTGKVVAYGPQTDAVRGYYILAGAEPAAADDFVRNDPAVKDRVFKEAARLTWAVAVNGFEANKQGESYFILRFGPGAKWVKGKSVTEQNIAAHFGYMIEQSKKGVVVAAGPSMAGNEGLYVVRGTRAVVDALIAADPGVKGGIFKPQIIGWNVLAMQAAK